MAEIYKYKFSLSFINSSWISACSWILVFFYQFTWVLFIFLMVYLIKSVLLFSSFSKDLISSINNWIISSNYIIFESIFSDLLDFYYFKNTSFVIAYKVSSSSDY